MIRSLILAALLALVATALPVRAADPAAIEVPVIASLTGPLSSVDAASRRPFSQLASPSQAKCQGLLTEGVPS